MNLKTIKKNVTKNYLMFPPEMYTCLVGSIVITSYILNEKKPELKDIKKKWKKVVRHGLPFNISDEKYIDKVLEVFEMEKLPKDNVAVVTYFKGKYQSMLVVPYDPEQKQIFPLREDGLYTLTLRKGTIYPLIDGAENEQLYKQSVSEN